ncbi:MAG: V-type ATPase subunit [Nitrososphaerota archaeon]
MREIKLDSVYSVARSYALKSYLLPYPSIEELVDSRSLEDFVDRLRATPYGSHLAQMQRPITPIRVERALWRSLVDTHFSMMRTSHNRPILDAYFSRHLHINLKAVLRGKAIGKSYEEIMETVDLYPETLLHVRDQVMRAVNARDIQSAVAEVAKTELGNVARISLRVWSEHKDLAAFDAAVDRIFLENLLTSYQRLSKSDRKDYKAIISLDVDTGIAVTILRLRSWGVLPPDVVKFIPKAGVEIGDEDIRGLLDVKEPGEAVSILSGAFAWLRTTAVKDFQTLIRELERMAVEAKISLASKYYFRRPMRNVLTLAILILKEAEVRNLATIATGLYEAQPSSSIISRLVKTV